MSEPGTRFELRDLNLRIVLVFASALAAFGVLVHGLVSLTFAHLEHRKGQAPPRIPHPAPPPPRLEEDPSRLLEALRDREQRELGTYGWVDRGRGIVRIPIERAMDLLLEKGLPARKTTEER